MQPTRSPFSAAPSVASIWQLLNLHRPEAALRLAEQLLATNPSAISPQLARIEALRQLSRLTEAVAAARIAIGHAPQSAFAHAALARLLGQQGYLGAAEQAILEALRLNANEASYFAFLANIQCLLRDPDEAIASAAAGLRLNARHSDCLLWRAMAQEQNGQLAAADADFALALRVAPTSYLLHYRRGQQLLARAEARSAAHHLAEALRLRPMASAEVLPLLRQARHRQQWPAWFSKRHQQLCYEWRWQRALSWQGGNTLLLLAFFKLQSWWLTRHDPLFWPSRRQVWQRWQKAWLLGLLLLPVLIVSGDYLHFFDASTPLSMLQMLGLLTGGLLFQLVLYLMKRKIDSLDA